MKTWRILYTSGETQLSLIVEAHDRRGARQAFLDQSPDHPAVLIRRIVLVP